MSFSIQDARLSDLVSRIPVFENVKKITPLGGGLTNMNYRVETATGTYVMRVSDSKSGLLGINRENERINTMKAHEAGVGASVIDSLIKENVLVISWIEAKTLHAENIHKEEGLLRRIAVSMKKLHNGPAFQGEFYFPVIRKKYLQAVIENNYFLPDQYKQLEPLILQLEQLIKEKPEPFVPCNNDLLAENFMDDGKKIWIIDYEYSGQNEASFDLGNLAGELFLNEEETTILCDTYWQEHSPSKIARAMAWSMIARYGWVLWASIQEAVSPIDFDFRTWGLKKWNSVLPELEGEHYQKVLNQLK
ncbi:MAG: phosphotransferase family protein [Bacteroidetes bacterium]|nr:phosphotransferase family protein [Bacteroidota bacterium]MBS1611072.1 phosphotransferase family protein [Bacteroidota bacterium]